MIEGCTIICDPAQFNDFAQAIPDLKVQKSAICDVLSDTGCGRVVSVRVTRVSSKDLCLYVKLKKKPTVKATYVICAGYIKNIEQDLGGNLIVNCRSGKKFVIGPNAPENPPAPDYDSVQAAFRDFVKAAEASGFRILKTELQPNGGESFTIEPLSLIGDN